MPEPVVVLLDIETLPATGLFWGGGLHEQTILKVLEHPIVCGFSAKISGGDHITKILPDYKLYKADQRNDYELICEIHTILDRANLVIAHNGDRFDLRKLNARFAYHGLTPPSPYQTYDTLKVCRKLFGFTSNKLTDVCAFLGIGEKLPHEGFSLWTRCMEGDTDAWAVMRAYNRHDITLLEELYLRVRPRAKHPSLGLLADRQSCSQCGSTKTQYRGYHVAKTQTYRRYQCVSCGGWSRSSASYSKSETVPL